MFGISPAETTFERRGFRGGAGGVRERLEKIGQAFTFGYHAALAGKPLEALSPELNAVELEFRGFAFEGAAMALALLDYLTPWRRNRVRRFLNGAGQAHAYMIHVGVGWVLARLPVSLKRAKAKMEPLLCWLAIDGYGFHEAFFHWPRYIQGQPVPRKLTGYDRRAFDQGFGRCLWFVDGADVGLIPRTVAGFSSERHADLWSGIGLASTYAGGVGESALKTLRESAGRFRPELSPGAAFAAKARERAGNITAHTQLACEVLCGTSAEEAAQLTDAALENLPVHGTDPAYEVWRRRIQDHFAKRKELRP
jgi:enediyne biosynthesis protein E3